MTGSCPSRPRARTYCRAESMKFVSTRGQSPAVSFGAALTQGLAPDGGLYMPEAWPTHPAVRASMARARLPEVAEVMLRPFVEGDADRRRDRRHRARRLRFSGAAGAGGRCRQAVGARAVSRPHRGVQGFRRAISRRLAAAHPRSGATGKPLNILVATSGDTGGAVAAAFHRRPGVVVSVLFPKGLVSPTQERQLTCWGDNVHLVSRQRQLR